MVVLLYYMKPIEKHWGSYFPGVLSLAKGYLFFWVVFANNEVLNIEYLLKSAVSLCKSKAEDKEDKNVSVISNFIANAIKLIPKGTIEICLC